MTIKEKFKIRKARFNEYQRLALKYRKITFDFTDWNNIRAEFNEYSSEPIACIKTKVYRNEGGDPEWLFREINCSNFSEQHPCMETGCPRYEAYKKYLEHENLVRQARKESRAAFKRIFQRIK